MSALPPSAAIVKAVRQMVRTPSGKVSNSLSAALIHETGRVLLIISFALDRSCLSRLLVGNVVIYDNVMSSDDECLLSTLPESKKFISVALACWAEQHGLTLAFIKEGRLIQNGFIEGFIRRYREAVVDMFVFQNNGVLWRFIDTKKVKEVQPEGLKAWCRSWNLTPHYSELLSQKTYG